MLKRSPHSTGGVASSRNSWTRRLLRTASCTSRSSSGAAPRSSSTQRSAPPRITNSCCAKNQSAARPSPAWAPSNARPATRMRPAASRRTSSSAPSINNCSKRSSQLSSERGDTAANTRGRRSAGRCWASSKTTSASSIDGTQPLERSAMWPMRTVTPNAWVARASMGPRHSSMWGRMTAYSTSHAISNKLTKAVVRPTAMRKTHRSGVARRLRATGGTGAAAPVGWSEAGEVKDMKTSVRQPSGRQVKVQHAADRCGAGTQRKPIGNHRLARAVVCDSI